ncbi:unnamed protein product [Phytophthora lilii]|uniref:Unnamed protein product n=1 Tax=Phytophthora lilii TaxID=2077276 RepID=A0A9W6X976_9STRA|nr:unnamed protein product [Phytophthora lilii]
MERYLAINTWLEQNGINVAQASASGTDVGEKPKDYGLFDDMYNSLEVLENSLQSELACLGSSCDCCSRGLATSSDNELCEDPPLMPSPALFDYLAVIAADMIDVGIHNFWNQRENVFEATVAFAHPPESQFHAESLEHFCFPTGIKTTGLGANVDKRDDCPHDNLSSISREGDFFVLMISGGGMQGQSVQYAMCMKGTVEVRSSSGDGKNLLLPICYCIIAQIPLIPFFRAVLQGLLDNLKIELESSGGRGCDSLSSIVTDKHAGYIDDILQKLKKIPLPDKGLSMSADVFPPPSPELILTRPHKENDTDEKMALLLQWALPSLLSRLSIERLLQILSLLLVEMKLIVVSDEIPLLSSATLGLASLLHPLIWAGPLIIPLISGVEELPRAFECSKGTCILYLMENRIQLDPEDELVFDKLKMPGLENLSCDLTRFTKQMLGRVTGSFRDNVTPLSTHLVIHRVRRHVEHLINICTHESEHYRVEDSEQLSASEVRFVNIFMQTQMYQKYQDDQPTAVLAEQNNQQVSTAQAAKDQVPSKISVTHSQHDELKSAATVLFQVALAGVSTLPRSSSRVNIIAEAVADTGIDELHEEEEPQIMDEPTPGTVKSAASTPSADASSITSPGSIQGFELQSPSSGFLESPRRSPNNESDASFGDDPKSVSRSDHGSAVNTQRADTETTISSFDTALSEALGSADTTDDAWLFDTLDDQVESAQNDGDECDEERSTNLETLEDDEARSIHRDNTVKKDAGPEQNIPCRRRSWQQGTHQNDGGTNIQLFEHAVVTPEQKATLLLGVSVDSRGAWEGWCEGKMFVSSNFMTLFWERRAAAFAALNMNISDITGIVVEDDQTTSSNEHRQRRIQICFTSEVIIFQFTSSLHHDEFFSSLKHLIKPLNTDKDERENSFPSLPALPSTFPTVLSSATQKKNDDFLENRDEDKPIEDCVPHFSHVQMETDIDQFKRKLQHGLLVEKVGYVIRLLKDICAILTLCVVTSMAG